MARKKKEVFVVATSSCGDASQLCTWPDHLDICHSLETAKKEAKDAAEAHRSEMGEEAEKIFILQVVVEGTPNGVAWDD